MPPKNPNYGQFRSRTLKLILRNPLSALAAHWVFQSLLYMNGSERWFKIGLDIALTIAFAVLVSWYLPIFPSLFLSFVLAHTLNFIFNGQIWGVLKHYGIVYTPRESFLQYAGNVVARAKAETAIVGFVVCGSLSRSDWTPYSDFDGRVLRKPGIFNAARASWFVCLERARAFLNFFPIDLYVIDSHDLNGSLYRGEVEMDDLIHLLRSGA
jgi:predicted nucleotidyltransferase